MRILYLLLIVQTAIGQSILPSAYPDRIILNLGADASRSVGVNWRTDIHQKDGWVQFAKASTGTQFLSQLDSLKSTTTLLNFEEGQALYHSAMIRGLEPGNSYVYRVGNGPYRSEWFQFTLPAKELTFIYFGDAQNDVKNHWSRVIRKSITHNPDFILHGGDLINRHNRDPEWAEWFAAGSFIHASIPSAMTPGNHEFGKGVNNLSAHWKAQFSLPENGPDTLTETSYSIHFEDMVLGVLDATMMYDSKELEKASMQWLDGVFSRSKQKWKVVLVHFPLYSTKANRDNTDLRNALLPVLEKHNVDLILQGHDHSYGRGIMNKNNHDMAFVVSNAGPKMYPAGEDKTWMQKKGDFIQNYQVIKINNDQLEYQAFTADGALFDQFVLQKKGEKSTWIKN